MINQQVIEALQECQDKIHSLTGKHVVVTYIPAHAQAIRNILCNEFGVQWSDVMSKDRHGDCCKARHVYWWYQVNWFNKKIGALAHQHHTDDSTVKKALYKIDNILKDGSSVLCDAIERIGTQLKTFSN